MFFVECKPAGYSLREVKEQIENSINVVGKAFGQISGDVLIPVCYSKSHSSGCERAIDSYRVKSPKGLLTIKLLNYGDDITKALK